MSNTNTGGWAFPAPAGCGEDNGMTLRDYFAAKAMQAHINESWSMLSKKHGEDGGAIIEIISMASYEIADAMLKAREAK